MSKKLIMLLVLACLIMGLLAPAAEAAVYVRGYFRSHGTYVRPHFRSDPDGYFWNNWSSWGNYNPFTGQRGYRTYDSYLRSKLFDYNWGYTYTPSYSLWNSWYTWGSWNW